MKNRPKRRIAWIGDAGPGGGVPGMGRTFLCAMADRGDWEVHWYFREGDHREGELGERVTAGTLQAHPFLYEWDWDAWYGKSSKVAFVVSFLKRISTYKRLVKTLLEDHRETPFDVILQYSQAELFELRSEAPSLPLVLFPCVHAEGELRWLRHEKAIAKRCESAVWRIFREYYMAYRAKVQKRDYGLALGVIGMSRAFNREVSTDYGCSPERQGVVYHPIDPKQDPGDGAVGGETVRLLFVGRISVRKGLDLLLEVLPALLAKDQQVEMTFIGGGSLWSNYEPLMGDFPKERCTWKRALPNSEVQRLMQTSDILVVPSQYEPGGIVVGEALANGMIVVASDAVGSAENLVEPTAFHFATGDTDALRKALNRAIDTVRMSRADLRIQARKAAEQFLPEKMAELLLSEALRLSARHAN